MYMCIKPCRGFKDGDKVVVVNLSSDNHRIFLTHSEKPRLFSTFSLRKIINISWAEFKECFVEIDN